MGVIQVLSGRRTFLDTNILVYVFERYAPYVAELSDLLQAIARGELNVVVSELALAELLVKPMQENWAGHVGVYQEFMQTGPHFDVQPVSRTVLVEAARLRASSALKLPDAIHVATARLTGCEVFLTNDQRIKSIPDIEVIQLSSASA